MPKNALFALVLVLCMVPVFVLAQEGPMSPPMGPVPPAPGWNNSGNWMFPSVSTRNYNADELWRAKLGARVGYQWLNYNVDFPYPSNPNPALQVFAFERMKLELRNSDFWVGFVNVGLQPVQNLELYAIWGGNAPKEYSQVRMDATGAWMRSGADGNGGNTVSPWYWDTKFQWWTLDAGAVYWFTSDIGLELGFRSEHVYYQLKSPRNETVETRGGGPDPNGITIPCDRI